VASHQLLARELDTKKIETGVIPTIDRSQWKNLNLRMVSVILSRRAIPLAWRLLPHIGNSNHE